MIEAQCERCGQRYRPGTDHVCPKKAASAAASSHRPVPPATSGELPHPTGQANKGKKGAATKSTSTILAAAESAAAHLAPVTKKGTPRQRAPKGTFDRKAWQREAAKKRRAAAKAKAQ